MIYSLMMGVTAGILAIGWVILLGMLLYIEAIAFIKEQDRNILIDQFCYREMYGRDKGVLVRTQYDEGTIGMSLIGYPIASVFVMFVWPLVWLAAAYFGTVWYLREQERKRKDEADKNS